MQSGLRVGLFIIFLFSIVGSGAVNGQLNSSNQSSVQENPTIIPEDGNTILNYTKIQMTNATPSFQTQNVTGIKIETPEFEEHELPPIEVTNPNIPGPEQGTQAKIKESAGDKLAIDKGIGKDSRSDPIIRQISSDSKYSSMIRKVSLGDFKIFSNKLVCPPDNTGICKPCAIGGSCPSASPCPSNDFVCPWEINEPAVANKGAATLFVGNKYAARSFDFGNNWEYLNPAVHGRNFCCDQDVVYSARYGIFIWYLQGGYPSPPGSGLAYSTVAVSRDLINWWYYHITPTTFGRTNEWFDFPHVEISNNYMYLTTDLHSQQNGGFTGDLISGWNLRAMSNAETVPISYIVSSSGGIAPVQGATDTMYFGTNNVCEPGSSCTHSNHLLTVFKWPERSGTIAFTTVEIVPWQPAIGGVAPDCPSPGGINFCTGIIRGGPNAVSGGWVLDGLVGFIWNSEAGHGFPHSYINGAVLNSNTLIYDHRIYMYHEQGAVMQGHVAVSSGNSLSLGAYFGAPAIYPTTLVAKFNNDMRSIPSATIVMNGQASSANMGDYLRVRPYSGTGLLDGGYVLWVGSGYTILRTTNNTQYVQPFYYIFGTEGIGHSGNPFG